MSTPEFTLHPRARSMRVVNKLEFIAQLEAGVLRVLRERMGSLDGRLAAQIQKDVRHEFLSRVRHDGRPVRGMTKESFLAELERSRDRILVDRDRARTELERLQERLHSIRAEGSSHEDRPARGGFGRSPGLDLEERLRALFDVSTLAGLVPLAQERAILDFASQAVTAELERRGVAPERGGPDGEVALLERRIAKLTTSLSEMETTMAKLAALKDVEPGVASIYRTVQGLSEQEGALEQKRELLKDLFLANQALREALRR